MKHPNEILPHHKQKHESSCVAWGLELALKLHEKIGVNDYPLQDGMNPCGYGFGATEKLILHEEAITANDASFELDEFATRMLEENANGRYPIFTLPMRIIRYPLNPFIAEPVYHTFVSVSERASHKYLTRSHDSSEIHSFSHLWLEHKFHEFQAFEPGYKIHCLLYS
jgi:hypothetical protein